MARDLSAKCKQCRREGSKLFIKGEKCLSSHCPMLKRNYPPGLHGPTKKMSRLSGYGKQLREKQRAKRTYRILERQMKNYFLKASKKSGDTSENFIRLLETRLDNIIYRLGFATSRDNARQLVAHGHVFVNNKKLSIPSYTVKVGQEISIKPSSQETPAIKEQLSKSKKTELLGWLTRDAEKNSGKIVALPAKEELSLPFDLTLIIEFYSR